MSDFAVNENFADPTNGVPVDAIPPQQDNVEWVLIAEAEWKLNSHEKKHINLALNRYINGIGFIYQTYLWRTSGKSEINRNTESSTTIS